EGEIRAARDAAEKALRDLQAAQASLLHAQKMAALGQLTAGIAHEIKNPLNFVNNFAGLSVELLDELKETAAPAVASLGDDTRAEIDEIVGMLTGNLEKIAEQAAAPTASSRACWRIRAAAAVIGNRPTSTRSSKRRSTSPIMAPALKIRASTSRWNTI